MTHTMDMTRGKPLKALIVFSIPLMVASLLQQLYNTVDSIIVGRVVGLSALAAVGLCGTVIHLLTGFVTGLTNGAAVVVAQYRGAGDERAMRLSVTVSLFSACVAGLIMGALGVVLSPWMLRLISTPEDIIDTAAAYLRISFGLSIFIVIYNAGSAALRGAGDSRSPLIILLATCVANVALDLLFVAVLGMGVTGAAWATVAAQGVSAALVMLILIKRVPPIIPTRAMRGECILILRRILGIGLPTGIQQMIASMGGIVVQNLINGYGTLYIAANNILVKVDHFCVMPLLSFGIALNTFVGQNIGAKRIDRVKKGAKDALIISVAVAIVMCAFMITLGRYPMRLFTDSEEAIDAAMRMIAIITPCWIGFAAQNTISGVLRGVGNGTMPMLVSIFGLLAVRIPLAYLLTHLTGNPYMIWVTMGLNWLVGGTFLFVYYISGRWLKGKHLRAFTED